MERCRQACLQAARCKPVPDGAAGHAGAGGDGLKRCLGLRDVVGFGLGVTIGGGIYVAMGAAAVEAGPGVVASFLLAAMGCACSGLCYAEMATIAPSAGGAYSFSYHAIGELPAYITGVVNVMGNILSGAAVARGWVAYVGSLIEESGLTAPAWLIGFEVDSVVVSPAAVLLVALLGVLNLAGTRATSMLNGVITSISCCFLLVYVIMGASAVDASRWFPFFPSGIGGIVRGASDVFFAYLGFDALACLGEEATDPKVVPRGIVLTLLISTALYCVTATTFTGLVTGDEIDIGAPLAMAAQIRGLDAVAVLISISAVGNTLTTVVSGILGSPRVCYAMAQDGLLPISLTHVNKNGTPVRALWMSIIPMALLAGFVEFEELADIVSAGALCSFSLVCAALILLRCPVAAGNDGSCRSAASHVPPSVFGARDSEEISGRGSETSVPDAASFGRPPQSVTMGLGAYAASCFCADILLSTSEGDPFGTAAAALVFLGALSAAAFVIWPFCCSGRATGSGHDAAAEDPKADTSQIRMPVMPLLPMLGLFFNMLLLAHVPVKALLRTAALDLVCLVFYFVYGAPGSRLNEQSRPFAEERFDS